MDDDQDITIQDLYPELTPAQQEDEHNLLGYLDVISEYMKGSKRKEDLMN
jgi:hypothetical protein